MSSIAFTAMGKGEVLTASGFTESVIDPSIFKVESDDDEEELSQSLIQQQSESREIM
jgi:hypothetical protein